MTRKNTAGIVAATLAAVTITGALPVAAFAQGRGNADWKKGPPGQMKKKYDRRGDRHDDDRRDDRRDDRGDSWREVAAQQNRDEAANRQKTKNDWRNLAIASGGVAVFGLIKKDPYIGFAGLAGALYSLNRYEQDRKSQNALERARYQMFSQPYIYRDGDRYERRLVTKNGQKYYQFFRK